MSDTIVNSDFSKLPASDCNSNLEPQTNVHGTNDYLEDDGKSGGLEYSWSKVNVYSRSAYPKCNRKCIAKPPKRILHNVTGSMESGQLVALMGASGAGKTTLLNVLNLRNSKGLQVEGAMSINGKPVSPELLGTISAYIQQDDLFFGTLTVREHLTFHSLVRMRGNLTPAQRKARVNEVIHYLNLEKCSETRIGTPGIVKGISGGEMKRLAFASEMLTDPHILFCDEPTSGLDSTMAVNVVQVLRNMADNGKAIICTIHQPPSACFDFFDQILLMANGRVAYQGTKEGALNFFANLGMICPKNFNPADFFVQQLALARLQSANDIDDKKMDDIYCDYFEKTDEFAKIEDLCKKHAKGITLLENPRSLTYVGISTRYQSSFFRQCLALVWRSWLTLIREPNTFRIRLTDQIVIGVLIGCIYYQQTLSPTGVKNMTGAIYMIVTCLSFQNIFGVCNTFCHELPILLREHFNGMYRVDAYYLSKTLAETPLYIFYPILFTLLTYFTIGLNNDSMRFLNFLYIQILVSFVTVSFGYLISCAAGHTETALVLITPMIMPAMLFGGYFLTIEKGTYLETYFRWCQYISWFYYSSEALAINQWNDETIRIQCTNEDAPSYFCNMTGEQIILYMNYKIKNYDWDIHALLLLVIFIRLTAFIFLFLRTVRWR